MSNFPLFTSDLHAYHKNILKFSPDKRLGKDENEMTEILIENWNDQVPDKETVVYCLGDVSFGGAEKTRELLNRLNGTIHLILGNHDREEFMHSTRRFASISQYKRIKIEDKWVILFHYPIIDWEMINHGSYHLYGHIHGQKNRMPEGRALDVGIDNRPAGDMKLWTWQEVKDMLEPLSNFRHGSGHGRV